MNDDNRLGPISVILKPPEKIGTVLHTKLFWQFCRLTVAVASVVLIKEVTVVPVLETFV